MAKEDKADDASKDESEKAAGGKKRLVLMVVLGLVIIGVSVGGTLVAMKFLSPPPPVAAEVLEEGAEAEEPPPAPAIYYPIKPAIVVNFQVKGRQRFLQAELTLMTRDEGVVAEIETHLPMIRNALVLLIGGQVYAEIQTAEGKELLRQQCLQELQKIMEAEIGKPAIEQVLFTNFVMQ